MRPCPDKEQRRITRTEALKLAQDILVRAERERVQSADLEASGVGSSPKMLRLVICAAVRNIKTGVIVCGVRHGDCLNAVVQYGLDAMPGSETWECGFCDQERNFLTRSEAWKIADVAGQIRRPSGFEDDYESHRQSNIGDDGLLFSENLY